MRQQNVKYGEHIVLSPLANNQVKTKKPTVGEHLFCNYSAFYHNFSIQSRENKKVLLELKESLLIIRDQPSSNRSVTSAPF